MLSKVGIFGNAAIDHYVSAHTVCRKEDRVDITLEDGTDISFALSGPLGFFRGETA